MTHDQQTYRRAASAALTGLIVQGVLALGVLVLAMWAQSPAITAMTWHFFAGLPIWVVLLMIYHQHRLERAEALETEQYASRDAAAAAIFDERAQDLHVARRRLERLYKWGLGGVSVGLAVYLMLVGFIALSRNYNALQDESLVRTAIREDISAAPLVLAAVALALVAFLVARYVAGMTRVKEWQLLRGGASYLMGNALFAVLVLIAGCFAAFGYQLGFVILALAVPAIMAAIGLEIITTFLLSAYRPRRPGEVPRPAFDSRLLGWTTSPESLGRIISDTLNYQFGFEISRSWFYRLLSKAITPLIVLGLISLVLVSSVVVVEPHERAVIMRGGKVVRTVGPGPHLKMPWPLGRAQKYEVDRVHQVIAGSTASGVKEDAAAILWTGTHTDEDEQYLVTAPTQLRAVAPPGAEGQLEMMEARLPSDEQSADVGVALLAAESAVQYKIKDLDQYIQAVQSDRQMQEIVAAVADRCIGLYFATHDIDTLLSDGRTRAARELREAIQREADALELGIEVVFVGMAGVHPPQKDGVAESFHQQIAAFQEAQSTINDAEKQAVQILTEAAGSSEMAHRIDDAIRNLQNLKINNADAAEIEEAELALRRLLETEAVGTVAQTIHEARAYRWQRELAAQADVRNFIAAKAAYDRAPQYYMDRAWYEALAKHLPRTRKFIVDTDKLESQVYEINLKESSGAIGSLFEE